MLPTLSSPAYNVRLKRVVTSDVNSPETSYRYQGAFIYEDYADLNTVFNNNKEYYTQRQQDYETHLGFKLIADHFSEEKPCFRAALSVGCLERLLRLGSAYKGSDMETIKNTLSEWNEVAYELTVLLHELLAPPSTPPSKSTHPCSSMYKLSRGYFMKMQETSAKEFACYYGYDSTDGMVGGGGGTVRIYARDGDIPLIQRRTHRQAIMAKAPTIPACAAPTTKLSVPPPPPRPLCGGAPPPPLPPKKGGVPPLPPLSPSEGARLYYPELRRLQGLGPFTDLHLIIAALVGHDKSQIFIEKHVRRGEAMDMFLLPWDDCMDTDREFRVYVDEGSRVVAIAPWNPFGTYPTTSAGVSGGATRDSDASRVAFPWVDALSDEELVQLGADIASYVEGRIVPTVLAHTPFKSCTVDVLVREVAEGNDDRRVPFSSTGNCDHSDVQSTPPASSMDSYQRYDRRWEISLVETGPYGPFMHAGSTLFHWLEADVFDRGGSSGNTAEHTIDMRVLTDDCTKGERLSITKPVRRPDLFE